MIVLCFVLYLHDFFFSSHINNNRLCAAETITVTQNTGNTFDPDNLLCQHFSQDSKNSL